MRKTVLVGFLGLAVMGLVGCGTGGDSGNNNENDGANSSSKTFYPNIVYYNNGEVFGSIDSGGTVIVDNSGKTIGSLASDGTNLVYDTNGVAISVCDDIDDSNVNFENGLLVGTCTLASPRGDFNNVPSSDDSIADDDNTQTPNNTNTNATTNSTNDNSHRVGVNNGGTVTTAEL